jgi:hypothetical protein
MLIPIEAKDNQTLNDNIIALPCDYMMLTVKKCLKIYKK